MAEQVDGATEKLPVWLYGINDHLDAPSTLPSSFQPSGLLCADFRALSADVKMAVHPAFKIKKKMVNDRHSKRSAAVERVHSVAHEPKWVQIPEGPVLTIRSFLMDRSALQLLSLLLPVTSNVKVLCFSECRLDIEMLKLLRQGLTGACLVESLQIEWNPLDLPLGPLPEEPDLTQETASAPVQDWDTGASTVAPSEAGSKDGMSGAAIWLQSLEAQERKRYTQQSQRLLRSFREWLEQLNTSLEATWSILEEAQVSFSASFSQGQFHELMTTTLGVSGRQVVQVFDVLDGPDFGAGMCSITLDQLREALEGLPDLGTDTDLSGDPIGVAFASFLDGESVLESFSVRACELTRMELVPLANALAACPWQLRVLNLWENRICDRGAEILAGALNVYRGLEYLGLGCNRITEQGMQRLCAAFQITILDEAGAKDAREKIKQQQAAIDAQAKAAAKAKAQVVSEGSRRQPSMPLDQLEEKTTETETTYILRRPCELRSLVLSDNPIASVEIVEACEPLGPQGADLILRGTPVAEKLTTKRPDLLPQPKKTLGVQPVQAPVIEGWVVRIV